MIDLCTHLTCRPRTTEDVWSRFLAFASPMCSHMPGTQQVPITIHWTELQCGTSHTTHGAHGATDQTRRWICFLCTWRRAPYWRGQCIIHVCERHKHRVYPINPQRMKRNGTFTSPSVTSQNFLKHLICRNQTCWCLKGKSIRWYWIGQFPKKGGGNLPQIFIKLDKHIKGFQILHKKQIKKWKSKNVQWNIF